MKNKNEYDMLESIELKIKRKRFKKNNETSIKTIKNEHIEHNTEMLSFNSLYDSDNNKIITINFKECFEKFKHDSDKKQITNNKSGEISTEEQLYCKNNFFMHKCINQKSLQLVVDEVLEYSKDKSSTSTRNIKILPFIYITVYIDKSSSIDRLYSKIVYNINPEEIIDSLSNGNKESSLIKIKEFLKLYKLTGNTRIYDLIRNEKNKVLKSKILYILGNYTDAFLVIKNTRSMLRYKILYMINKEKCIMEIKNDLYSYKHYLFYISIMKEYPQQFINELYLDCIKRFPHVECKLSYIRFLKWNNLGINEEDFKEILDERVFYEIYIYKRKNLELSYKALSKYRKKLIKKKLEYDLLDQEMCYLENKECKADNKYYHLYYYKTKNKLKEGFKVSRSDMDFYETELKRSNGDILLIMYLLNIGEYINQGNIENMKWLEMLYNIYNLKNGLYWTRTRHIHDFETRLKETVELFKFDQEFNRRQI